LGAALLGEPVQPDVSLSALPAQWIASYLWPIVIGMGVFAAASSAIGYVLVKLTWRMKTVYKRMRRRAPAEMTR